MKKTSVFLASLFALAFLLKVALLFYVQSYAPRAEFQIDSHDYLKIAETFQQTGVFARGAAEGGPWNFEFYRTPGYPLFLAIFHFGMHLPFSAVLFFQVILTLLAAGFIYKAAVMVSPRMAPLAYIIMLFDPAINVYSVMALTESLFLFFLSAFLFFLIRYWQKEKMSYLIFCGLLLVAAVYVRPIAYYLGFVVAIALILGKRSLQKKMILKQTAIFLILVYSLIVIWQIRNYVRCGRLQFSSVMDTAMKHDGLLHSYQRNLDPISRGLPPVAYYANVTIRSFLSLMTRPVSFKNIFPLEGKAIMKVICYLWILFWSLGLLFGIMKAEKIDVFGIIIYIFLYFIIASVVGGFWGVGSRFRVALMPMIAILSAYGWERILSKDKNHA